MKKSIVLFTVLALCATFTSTPAHAAADPVIKCHLAKVKAASKAFAAMLKCEHLLLVDATFDVATCIQDSENKMIAAFAAADTKYGTCQFSGNGPAEATSIYGDVILITGTL